MTQMNSVSKPSRATRWIRVGLAGLSSLIVVAGVSSGCLDRPVEEQEPSTSNVFVTQFAQTAVDKIDLLFMIDNSQSMADKQQILALAVPQLVSRLLNPPCVDDVGNAVDQPAAPGMDCAQGSREFEPISDVHIGVVSSSLGGIGGPFCEPGGSEDFNETQRDMAHLIGSVRTLANTSVEGFLNWDNRAQATRDADTFPDAPPINDIATLTARFTEHVIAAGEVGCGFEASLESWYRFLIDPKPYLTVSIPNAQNSQGVPDGIDDVILTQRDMFLRGDSLVAVIMLTDENDCSIKADGLGNLVTTFVRNNSQFLMRRGTSVCDQDPNNPCCKSCATSEGAWGDCPAKSEVCKDPAGNVTDQLTAQEDASNLRCFNQKRRFGMDLLYPTSRYSVGLKSMQLCPDSSFGDGDCACAEATARGLPCTPGAPVANPLYSSGTAIMAREADLVFLAGIIGVPWQLIATEETRATSTPNLRYMTAAEMGAANTWAEIVGDPDNNVPPSSIYMVESITPREGLPGPDSTSATADPINGHEWNAEGRDLQYACIFPLPTATDCTTIEEGKNCDCSPSSQSASSVTEDVETAKKPLCQNEAGAYTTTQYRAKAYPGLRELEVLKDYGENSVVASVCPKTLTGTPTDASYGYNPAVNAIVDRLKEKLGGKCLPRALAVDEDTKLVPCEVVEAIKGTCNCDPNDGRIDLSDKGGLVSAVRAALKENLACEKDATDAKCTDFCMCGIRQFGADAAEDREKCLNDRSDAPDVRGPGYCYIDAMDPTGKNYIGNPELVANCEPSQRRLLRFVGDNTPARGSITFIACSGERIR